MLSRRLFFFVLVFGALFTACTDDDTFSTSRSNVLSFSVDTVKLDTLFSTVPSVTKTFWVRNNSGDGIRIQTADQIIGGTARLHIALNGGASLRLQLTEAETAGILVVGLVTDARPAVQHHLAALQGVVQLTALHAVLHLLRRKNLAAVVQYNQEGTRLRRVLLVRIDVGRTLEVRPVSPGRLRTQPTALAAGIEVDGALAADC